MCVCVCLSARYRLRWQADRAIYCTEGQTWLQTAAAHIWLPGSLGNWRAQRQKAGKQEGGGGPIFYLPSVPNISHEALTYCWQTETSAFSHFSFLFVVFFSFIKHKWETWKKSDDTTGWTPDFKSIVPNSFHKKKVSKQFFLSSTEALIFLWRLTTTSMSQL